MGDKSVRYSDQFWENLYQEHLSGDTYDTLSKRYGVSKGSISPKMRAMKALSSLPLHESTPKRMYKRPIGPKLKLLGKSLILSKIKVNEKTGCWEWTGVPNSAGYGQLTIDGVYWASHRYSYTHYHGDIPKGLVVRHKCHNRICCNPDHLDTGTHKDNYHDSEESHAEGKRLISHAVSINGKTYPSMRKASLATGIHQGTIAKHKKNGIFDIDSYREACKISNAEPNA